MDALELLLKRASCAKLTLPKPNQQQMENVIRAALRAPDHAGLKPWNFLIYDNQASLQALGNLFVEAKLRQNPELPTDAVEKTRNLPLRAPMVVVAVAKIQEHQKVPAIEQIVSCGCAVHAMLYALQAQGYAGYWRTGELAYNPHLKTLLGLASTDEIVGFLYVGTPVLSLEKNNSANIADFVDYR
jgi:nitroreductase